MGSGWSAENMDQKSNRPPGRLYALNGRRPRGTGPTVHSELVLGLDANLSVSAGGRRGASDA
jgi:hypothetical protein